MNLKELEKLIKLCRKQGVESVRFDGIELHLGAAPMPKAISHKAKARTTTAIPGAEAFSMPDIDTPDELTPEQLLNWSVGQDQ